MFAETGNHESGKSTLVSRLSTATGEAPKNESDGPLPTLDLGLSYSCVDVGEEDAEEGSCGWTLRFQQERMLMQRATRRRIRQAWYLPATVRLSAISCLAAVGADQIHPPGFARRDCVGLGKAVALFARAEGLDTDARSGTVSGGRRLGGSRRSRTK